MNNIKKIITLILYFILICSTSFSAENEVVDPMISDIAYQEKYDALSEVVPCYIMLKTTGTSMVSQEVLDQVSDRVNKAMVNSEKMKPISLDKWLIGKYGLNKAKNVKDFIDSLADEQYPCMIKGACHPYIFKISDGYVIKLSFYEFNNSGYPITTIRKIESLRNLGYALSSMIDEYQKIITTKSDSLFPKKTVIVKPFTLESRKYIGQAGGEFDYIPSTFIEQDGILIRSTDDIFSGMLAYSLYSTQMVKVIPAVELNSYVDAVYNTYDFADYYIEGRIQLTDQINIYHISLFDSKTKRLIKSVKFFSSDFSIVGINIANNNIVYSLADSLFGEGKYGVSPDIKVPGQGLFLNNIFIGWDSLEKCVLPKGKHIIYTGDYFTPDSTVEIKNKSKAVDINGDVYRSFFLYLDERNWLFRGKDGERVWNLLEK